MNRLSLSCVAVLLLTASQSTNSAETAPEKRELPAPWKHVDLGLAAVGAAPEPSTATPPAKPPVVRATVAGSAAEADGVFRLQGTSDLWGTADGCHFVYQPADGDVELIARVAAMENPGGVDHAKASLSIRASLEAGAPQVTFAVTATDGTQLLHRDELDGKTAKVPVDAETQKTLQPKAKFPVWIKLTRAGDAFTAYESADGATWSKAGAVSVKLPAGTVVGIAASSHKPDVVTTATFDHVTIKPDAASRPAAK